MLQTHLQAGRLGRVVNATCYTANACTDEGSCGREGEGKGRAELHRLRERGAVVRVGGRRR